MITRETFATRGVFRVTTVEKGVPVQPNEKTRIYERASAGEQTFTTTTARSKNASTVGTTAVSFEQL
jgi:hypothetical protein